VCTLADRIDAALLAALAPPLRVVATFAVGHENIDLDAARRLGVHVANTPGVLTDATAEIAVALALACARRIAEGDRFTRAGRFEGWGPLAHLGHAIYGCTVGIVGAGRIGRRVATTLRRGFDCEILVHSRRAADAPDWRELGVRSVSLDELLARADVVSLHCPHTPETHHLIDARALARMKPTAVLVNTARGAIVDEAALVAALRAGTIAAAGLDVYEHEPAPRTGSRRAGERGAAAARRQRDARGARGDGAPVRGRGDRRAVGPPCGTSAGISFSGRSRLARYSYERLSAQDNAFLLFESANLPMHVASTQIFELGPLETADGGVDYAQIKRFIGSVLHRIPRYRQKLRAIPLEGSPVWIDDEHFELDYHVRHTSLPRPGTDAQLRRARRARDGAALDRARPLWEIWVVEGPRGRPLRADQQDPSLHDRRQLGRRSRPDPAVADARRDDPRGARVPAAARADRLRAPGRRRAATARDAVRARADCARSDARPRISGARSACARARCATCSRRRRWRCRRRRSTTRSVRTASSTGAPRRSRT
jgi:lactate dehydrogenase-like 2-hydroxyacid dehydrogenase